MRIIKSNADSFFYLSFTLFNAILYTIIKYISMTTGLKTLAIAGYMNIGMFIIYNIAFYKTITKEKLYQGLFKFRNFIFISSALSALIKMYVIQYIQPKDATIITHGSPFVIMLFAYFFLNEKMRLKDWICVMFSMAGLVIYVSAKFDSSWIYYAILLLHVIFKAVQHIAIRNVSKTSILHVIFYESFFLFLFAIFYFSFVSKTEFEVNTLLSYQTLVTIFITTASLFSLAKSYSVAKNGISRLQNLDFSKVLFTFIFGAMFLDKNIHSKEIIGGVIITASMLISQYKSKKKA